MSERVKPESLFLQTFSGKLLDPLDPDPEQILIEDIAHALAAQCRFNGHYKKFYSRAEHCVHVSEACDPDFALLGLLHDAASTYLLDYSNLAGQLLHPVSFARALSDVEASVAHRFDLSFVGVAQVEERCHAVLHQEHFLLMPQAYPGFKMTAHRAVGRLTISLPCWSPEEAERAFLRRFATVAPMELIERVLPTWKCWKQTNEITRSLGMDA